jgi:hypothetical protein
MVELCGCLLMSNEVIRLTGNKSAKTSLKLHASLAYIFKHDG